MRRSTVFQINTYFIFRAGLFLALIIGSSLKVEAATVKNEMNLTATFRTGQVRQNIPSVVPRDRNRKAPESSKRQARVGFRTKAKNIVSEFVAHHARSGSDYDDNEYYYDENDNQYDENNSQDDYYYEDDYDAGNGGQYQDNEYQNDEKEYDDYGQNDGEHDYDYSTGYIETEDDIIHLSNVTIIEETVPELGNQTLLRRKRRAVGKAGGKNKTKSKGKGKGKGKGSGKVNCKVAKNKNKPICISKKITYMKTKYDKQFKKSKKQLDKAVKDMTKSKKFINGRITDVNTTMYGMKGTGSTDKLTETINSLNKTLLDTTQMNMELNKTIVSNVLVLANLTTRIKVEEAYSKATKLEMIKLTGFVKNLTSFIQDLLQDVNLNQTITSLNLTMPILIQQNDSSLLTSTSMVLLDSSNYSSPSTSSQPMSMNSTSSSSSTLNATSSRSSSEHMSSNPTKSSPSIFNSTKVT